MVVPTILCINLYKLHWAKPKATDVLKKNHTLSLALAAYSCISSKY